MRPPFETRQPVAATAASHRLPLPLHSPPSPPSPRNDLLPPTNTRTSLRKGLTPPLGVCSVILHHPPSCIIATLTPVPGGRGRMSLSYLRPPPPPSPPSPPTVSPCLQFTVKMFFLRKNILIDDGCMVTMYARELDGLALSYLIFLTVHCSLGSQALFLASWECNYNSRRAVIDFSNGMLLATNKNRQLGR